MNRRILLGFLVGAMASTFLFFYSTTVQTTNVSASEYREEKAYDYAKPEREKYNPLPINGYDPSDLPPYFPGESYGNGYYDHYESAFYEEQGYGIPYNSD
jgi:hypothetical protein